MCCPGPGSVSKESDSGPPLSFSEGIPGSLSESQLDILNDPAVAAFDRSLQVRARRGVVSGVPPPWRHFGPGTVAPSCRVPSRRGRPAVEGRMRPAGVLLCENESHDHVNSSLFCGFVDGMQGAGHGDSRSAEETVALQRSGARAAGLAWNGSRSAEEHAVLQRSGGGLVSLAGATAAHAGAVGIGSRQSAGVGNSEF